MQKKHTWLRLSLFTPKANWHYLLNEIELFVSQNHRHIADYLIEFNFLSGENIRLAILVSEDYANEISPVIDNYFKHSFFKNNLMRAARPLPVAGIFKPFDQNTIQYGLFDISYNQSANETKLGTKLSRILISALQDDEIDDETLITLAFYLHAALLKVANDRSEAAIEIKNYYINSNSLNEKDIDIAYIDHKFKNNKQELIQIYQSIMIDNQSDLPDWMVDWIAYVKDEIEPDDMRLTDILQTEKYYKIISLVNSQLGISRNSWRVTSYFLQQTSDVYRCANS